jgi:hypothetical protein
VIECAQNAVEQKYGGGSIAEREREHGSFVGVARHFFDHAVDNFTASWSAL